MKRSIHRLSFVRSASISLAALAGFGAAASAETVFAGPANFGGTTGIGLFLQQGGQVTQIDTGHTTHHFPWLSRNGRFISFSSPDPTVFGSNPSSDLYIYDLATGVKSRVVNHSSGVGSNGLLTADIALSSAVSPDGTLVAYGVMHQQNQGVGNSGAGRDLNVIDTSTGLGVHLATAISDQLLGAFTGISWAPDGGSFVTSAYMRLPQPTAAASELPAIFRYVRNPGGGFSQALNSVPQIINGGFGAAFQIYPAISPSGAGLAYFTVEAPNLFDTSQPARVSVVRANADGSGATVLATFNPGFYPLGMDWSEDGAQLVFSLGQQFHNGVGFTYTANAETAQTYSIRSTDGGGFARVPGLQGAFWPSVGSRGSGGTGTGGPGSLDGVQLSMVRTGAKDFELRATGVDPGSTYQLQSSTGLAPSSFGQPQEFTGQQLLAGISVRSQDARRFFRLVEP